MQTARDRQKSYADLKRKPMEFQVGDKVMLNVSPWKGVTCFGKRGKLNPRYVGPFKVLEKVKEVAYKLELPEELSRVHNTFHFAAEPIEITDSEVKRLKRSRIPLVKVRWNSRRGTDIKEMDKIKTKPDKTKHGIRKSVGIRVQRCPRILLGQPVNEARAVMSSDFAVTYTFVHFEARSWSILSEDPYQEVVRQLLEQAPRPSEYVPDPMELEDHVLVYIPKTEHPKDLVPAEDEALIEPYINEVASAPTPPLPPPSLLPTLIRPPHTRAAMAQRRATTPSIYHSLLPAETLPLLPIPLPAPSTSRKADIPEANTPPRKRILLTAPTPRV
ncbi:hypothetical protein Tco_0610585 [Tanacetum coccineum]